MPLGAPIQKITLVSQGRKPEMGSIPATPIRIDVQTTVGPDFLEILPSAAAELMAALSKHLQAHGYP